MPADKLGLFMKSGTFLKRANAAVTEAVRDLEEKGIKPAYIVREKDDTSQDAEVGASESSAKRRTHRAA